MQTITLPPSHHRPRLASRAVAHAQRGVSLIFALITMVALSLAAVALIRSVDTNTLVLGNLGFKQDTVRGADYASRIAIDWLSANIADSRLNNDWVDANTAYYATTRDTTANPLDVTGNGTGSSRTLIDWAGNSCNSHSPCLSTRAITDTTHNVRARYVVLRLCDATGDPTSPSSTINCARPLVNQTSESGERGSLNYANSQRIGTTTVSQYFRILVRTTGGRDTATITETLVHF